MTVKKENLSQVDLEGIKAISDELNQIPKTISVEHTRLTGRVWSDTGASYDRAQGIEDGEKEIESWIEEEPNPDYESLVKDLRLIYQYHPSGECRKFAGRILGYSNCRIEDFGVEYERRSARFVLVVFALGLLGLLLVWVLFAYLF